MVATEASRMSPRMERNGGRRKCTRAETRGETRKWDGNNGDRSDWADAEMEADEIKDITQFVRCVEIATEIGHPTKGLHRGGCGEWDTHLVTWKVVLFRIFFCIFRASSASFVNPFMSMRVTIPSNIFQQGDLDQR